MNIGEKIKEQRLRKELTQEQLGKLLNVSRPTVSSWEVGRNYPDLETIVALSDLFGISLDDLLREDREVAKDLTKKVKRNKLYKGLLIVIGIIVVILGGMNIKMRMDENKYIKNLAVSSWKEDVDSRYEGGYNLKEGDTLYATYIIHHGWNIVPMNTTPWVIGRKDEKLVVQVKNKNDIDIVISKANDKEVKYEAKLQVDAQGNPLPNDSEWSENKKKFVKKYYEEHQTEFTELVKNSVEKWQEINGKF